VLAHGENIDWVILLFQALERLKFVEDVAQHYTNLGGTEPK
jgi:hypothetical protein